MKNKLLSIPLISGLFLIGTTLSCMDQLQDFKTLDFQESTERCNINTDYIDELFNLLKLEAETADFLKSKQELLSHTKKLELLLDEQLTRLDVKTEQNEAFQTITESFNTSIAPQKEISLWSMRTLIVATAIPLALDALKNKEKSFLVKNMRFLADQTITRYAAISGACGIGITLGLRHQQAIKQLEAKHHELIKQFVNEIENLAISSWNNKAVIAKASMLLGALLYANYLTRGEKSLISHINEYGCTKIIPSIIDQCIQTAAYTARLFLPAE